MIFASSIKLISMKRFTIFTFLLLIPLFLLLSDSCSKEGGGINIFSLQNDIKLGKQADQQIMQGGSFLVLDSAAYPTAYQHLYRIRNTILASGQVSHKNDFPWRCRILKNDTIINAFSLPGGYMYFYTGLIKLLDNEAEFGGVMGHEMAHADCRHTTEMLTAKYGVDILLSLILGDNPDDLTTILTDLGLGLGTLAYSRQNEYEADSYAVQYLYPTELDAASLGDFFQILAQQPHPPAFLSTHPSPEDRLQKIQEKFAALGGVHGGTFPERYQEFKISLP
jgi:predicted Zn-dependent protease